MEDDKKTDSREWELDAETEYRFELDPGTSLAIKVRLRAISILWQELNHPSWFKGKPRFLVLSLRRANNTCLDPSAKHQCSLGKAVFSR
jgi:hypothetical protein